MLQWLGAFLIVNTGLLAIARIYTTGSLGAANTVLTVVFLAIGAAFALNERLTELSFDAKGTATIKTKVAQAEADAATINELKGRVEAQSATVDLVAMEASTAKHLVNDLSEKNIQAERKLRTIDAAVQEAEEKLGAIQDHAAFMSTVLGAQTDDRDSFDQLWEWAQDSSHKFRQQSEAAVLKIMDQHNQPFSLSGFQVPWNPGVDPTKLTLQQVASDFAKAPPPVRVAILEYVWRREDLPKRERLEFLVEVLRMDKSLTVVEYAGRYFAEGTANKIKPIAIVAHLDWWEKNKDSIDNPQQKLP
jgi:hypothetical protein